MCEVGETKEFPNPEISTFMFVLLTSIPIFPYLNDLNQIKSSECPSIETRISYS